VETTDAVSFEKFNKTTSDLNSLPRAMKQAALFITFAPAGTENMFIELDEDSSSIQETSKKYGTVFEI